MSSIWCDRALKKIETLNYTKNDLIKCDRLFENIEILIDVKNNLLIMRSSFLKILSDAKSDLILI